MLGIFPNRDSIIRLIGAVVGEIHDEWAVVRRYLTLDDNMRAIEAAPADAKPTKPALKKAS